MILHPIKPEKHKAWHSRSHPYFTKQAANVVATYIEHHTKPGETVLDPFGGTGVTAIEALRLRRKAIIMDLNPLACFIMEQTCKQIDTNRMKTAYSQLEAQVKKPIEDIYKIPNEELAKNPPKQWYPKDIILPKNPNFDLVEDLYTPRQLHSYALLFETINAIRDIDIQNIFKYIFSGTISRANLTFHNTEKKLEDGTVKKLNGGAISILSHYAYWKPKVTCELNVWKYFKSRFNLVVKGKERWNSLIEGFSVNENLQVICGSILNLSDHVPDESIDYIYTDPPYGSNITYIDLSIMWNAWLFPDIFADGALQTMQKQEIIEGGDLCKSQSEYVRLFSQSFEHMAKVLKPNKWLSCVFAHKKLEFWNTIVESCENNGMELKGSTYQPTNNSSMHYKKNPANVLCSQRIANFQKTFQKAQRHKPDDLKQFILNEIEKVILETNGASIDIIYQKIVDSLLKVKNLGEAKRKGYLRLEPFLENETLFFFDEKQNRYLLVDHPEPSREYLKHLDELRIYVKEFLTLRKSASLDEIHKHLFEIFKGEKVFPIEKDLPQILSEVGDKSLRTDRWLLKAGKPLKLSFPTLSSASSSGLKKIEHSDLSHSEVIFRLVEIGRCLGYGSWIGKREQSVDSFQGVRFSDLSVNSFVLGDIDKEDKAKIMQIDVLWIDTQGYPRYGFEVEESTSVLSGFERFSRLLKFREDLAKHLFIVSPRSRRIKLMEAFSRSTYIGYPLYLDRKFGLIYKESLISFYDSHLGIVFEESSLKVLYEELEVGVN